MISLNVPASISTNNIVSIILQQFM